MSSHREKIIFRNNTHPQARRREHYATNTFSGLYLTGLALTARCRQQQRRKSLGGETTTLCGARGSVICNESYRKYLPVPAFLFRHWELLQGQPRFKYSSHFI